MRRCFQIYLIGFLCLLLSGYAAGEKSASNPSEASLVLKKSEKLLNVVYFLGSDAKPVPGYERRLSELLLYLQQFYGREMARNGYGARSFGLDMRAPGLVNIFVYKAKHAASYYPYEGGGDRVLDEMEVFYEEHPDLKKSGHTLFILPTRNDKKNGSSHPGGVPFYGMGRDCFALDYPAFDIRHLGKETEEGQLLTKWYGGLAHELGHGLNLPHNHATASDGKKWGTALMGEGNYTYGSSPTFLTPASCAILDVCEVFSENPAGKFYQDEPSVDIKGLAVSLSREKDMLSLSGGYSCCRVVRALNVYVLDPPYAESEGRDYDAVSFSFPMGKKKGSFSVTIDRKELEGLTGSEYLIELMFVLENGHLFSKKIEFKQGRVKEYREKAE